MRYFVLTALVLLLATSPVNAATACHNPDGRPSVGLVLSGGGARGAAHVGVLKVLEALRVPIDCIAGTSMGAIVGGLYASGHSASEIELITLGIDWPDSFRDAPKRRDLSFRRKQDDYSFLVDLNLGFRGGKVRLPKGLVQGQKLRLLLRRLTLPVRSINDFDLLPTPFRSVAADAENGAAVVLGKGDIVDAMHASVSAPGIFAPVVVNNRILIDGGVVNNLPVNVIRAMGADIVIAVDIGFPLLPRDALDSAIALSNQALTILIRREADRQLATLAGRDIAILPDLGTLGSSEFDQLRVMIPKGEEAARAKTDVLREFALDERDYNAFLAKRQVARDTPRPVLGAITVEDDSRLAQEVIRERILSAPGQPFDVDQVERDLTRIYGLNIFEFVDYRLLGDEQPTLAVRARKKTWGPSFVNFGLDLSDDLEGSSGYNFGLRHTRTQVNSFGAEWRTDAQIGRNPRLFSEFYQPVGYASRFFLAPQLEVQKFNSTLFSSVGRRVAQYRVSEGALGLEVGYLINNKSELRAGMRYQTGRAKLRIGDEGELQTFQFDGGQVSLDYRYDDLDSTTFPRAGARGRLSVEADRESLGSDADLERVSFNWLGVRSPGKTSFAGSIVGGANLGSDGQIDDQFGLGGFLNLSGYKTNELRGQHQFAATFAVYRRIDFGGNFRLPLYLGGSLEAGNVWNTSSDIRFDSLRYGGSAFIGLDTPIGPLYLAYGLAQGGTSSAYFFLGQTFGQ